MAMNGVSVVICCYNSEKRIEQTLTYLSRQHTSHELEWEIILVDNASTDNTSQIATQIWENFRSPVQFRIVYENNPGLNYARQKGFVNSKYAYIILCDDDNWLDENYIQYAFNLMDDDSRIGVIGGRSNSVCEVEPPDWFEQYKGHYAVGTQSHNHYEDSEENTFVWGAAMVIRREALQELQKIGFSSVLSDRKGNSLQSGGDKEMCIVIKEIGYKILYSELLQFSHFIPKERLTWRYHRMLNRGFGSSDIFFEMYSYVSDKMRGAMVLEPIKYWRKSFFEDLKKMKGSYIRLLYFLSQKGEGEHWVVKYERTYGRIITLWRIRRSYTSYINQIEELYTKIKAYHHTS